MLYLSCAKKNASKAVGDLKSVAQPAVALILPPGVAHCNTRNFGITRALRVRTFHIVLENPNLI